jgi:hypothetical protein
VEDKKEDKNEDQKDSKDAEPQETCTQRCGCGVSLNVKFPGGLDKTGTVIYFNDAQHNHPLRPDIKLFGRKARTLAPEIHAFLNMHAATCRDTTELRRYLRAELLATNGATSEIPADPRVLSTAIWKAKKRMRVCETGSESQQLLDVLQEAKRVDSRWFYATFVDSKTKELRMVLWMSPDQQALYRRYSDVVVMDNTAQTNRLNMPLTAIVVVDSNGKTRLVASALSCGETNEPYAWILERFLEASMDQDGSIYPPRVVMCDHEPALLMAIRRTMPTTHIVNCIWHIYAHNIRSRLVGPLKKDFGAFMRKFWRVLKSLTFREFRKGWNEMVALFRLKTSYPARYLRKVRRRREHWAQYKVKMLFTAGMQSTQRVEKTHDLIKINSTGPSTSLKRLFQAIQDRVDREALTSQMDLDRELRKGEFLHKDHDFARLHFPAVVEVNKRYVSPYIRGLLMDEMKASQYFDCRQIGTEAANSGVDGQSSLLAQISDDLQDEADSFSDDEEYNLLVKKNMKKRRLESKTTSNVNASIDSDEWEESDTDKDDSDEWEGSDTDKHDNDEWEQSDVDERANDNLDGHARDLEESHYREEAMDEEEVRAVHDLMGKQQPIPKAALLGWLSEIGVDKIKDIYQVYFELPPKRPNYVVLLQDNCYLCTCRLQQSKGIVCGHFFRVMRSFPVAKYHISLIAKRWFLEVIQDKEDLKTVIMGEHAVHSASFGTMSLPPSSTYGEQYLSIFPEEQSAYEPRGVPSSSTLRHTIIEGWCKSFASLTSQSKEGMEIAKRILEQGFKEAKGGSQDTSHSSSTSGSGSGIEDDGHESPTEDHIHTSEKKGVQDVKTVAHKGRKRKLRFKAACEAQITSLKKGLPYIPVTPVPEISKNPPKRKKTACSVCGEIGHNKQRHSK